MFSIPQPALDLVGMAQCLLFTGKVTLLLNKQLIQRHVKADINTNVEKEPKLYSHRGAARGALRVLEHPHQLFSKLLTCIVLEYCTSADQTRS